SAMDVPRFEAIADPQSPGAHQLDGCHLLRGVPSPKSPHPQHATDERDLRFLFADRQHLTRFASAGGAATTIVEADLLATKKSPSAGLRLRPAHQIVHVTGAPRPPDADMLVSAEGIVARQRFVLRNPRRATLGDLVDRLLDRVETEREDLFVIERSSCIVG